MKAEHVAKSSAFHLLRFTDRICAFFFLVCQFRSNIEKGYCDSCNCIRDVWLL